MNQEKQQGVWTYILFPALAMMLGWGLRGHIGGGPFGAMIPGAMVTLTLGLLLNLSAFHTSVLVVFGVFGIGLGGEMTYGQTLGILREPHTMWWGLAGTTLKGAVWGFLGAMVLALGFIYQRIPRKTILIGFLVMLFGFYVGFKTINDPMLIYFSDRTNPRSESWAALLFGGLFLLIYLKYRLDVREFSLLKRFSIFGLIGGALGFGIGSLWMVMGVYFPEALFKGWWKAMEFSFGFLLGGSLGLAAWMSRNDIREFLRKSPEKSVSGSLTYFQELGMIAILTILIHAIIPYSLEPIIDSVGQESNLFMIFLRDVVRLLTGYGFYGIIMVVVLMLFPKLAWQIGITLTFAHAAIDLVRDFYPERNIWSPFTFHFFWVAVMTLGVGILTAWYRRRKNPVENLFLLLIWSCIGVSLLRLYFLSGSLSIADLSFLEIIFRRFFTDVFFMWMSIVLTGTIIWFKRNKKILVY